MLTAETKRRLDDCRDVLVGKLPLPTDQIELITLALIYKFMDDLDEESVKLGGKRSFFVGPLEKYRWRALLPQTVSADERMNLFAEGIEAIGKTEHLPALFRDIFRNSFLKFRDGRILTLFLNEVNGFVYSHSEELGNAFEYLLKTMGIQAENGQFRTPRHIIDFMVACLDPQPSDRILDPACGTGGFLVSCYKHILAEHTSAGSKMPGDKLTYDERQKVYSNLTGYDVTDLMVKLSKVNLFLHGFPDPAIHIYDTLTNDARWNEKADLILANPPFMTPKGGVSPHTKFRVSAKKSEVLFTDYIAEHLTPDGRGGVIVPNGIVATTQNAYVKLRKLFVEDSLVAVVSLPAGVFNPYSGVKTSILFLDKKLARKTDKILFLKINADGFDLGAQRRPILENDLPEAEHIVKAWFCGQIEKATVSSVVWNTVAKSALLAKRSISLQAEPFLGQEAVSEEIEAVRLGDVCVKCQQIKPSGLGRPMFRYIDIDSVDNVALRIAEPRSIPVSEAPSRARKLVKRGDVLFSTVRPYLKNIAIVPSSFDGEIASTGFAVIRADETRVLPEYLFAVLSNQRFVDTANALTTGASYPAVTENQLFDLEIPLPSLDEQRRIVAEVKSYQKVIDGARQILSSYKPQLDVNPEWKTVKLEDVADANCSLSYGIVQPGDEYPGGMPVVRPVDLTAKVIRLNGLKRIDPKLANGYKRSTLHGGELLLCVRGSTGVVSIAAPELAGANVTRGIVPIRFNRSLLLPEFGFYVMSSESVQNQIRAKTYGAALMQINIRDLRALELQLPPLKQQGEIAAELDAEAAQMEAVRALLPRFEAKIQRVLDRVWGNGVE
jgi:type I restriction enzyme M protein